MTRPAMRSTGITGRCAAGWNSSTSDGAKGRRHYDWAWVTISHPAAGCRYLLIRRNRHTGELAFYRCYSGPGSAGHPGQRRRAPVDHREKLPGQQGPRRPGRASGPPLGLLVRCVTLAMLAAAVLTIAAALESLRTPAPAGQIPLTRNEIARLFAGHTTKHPHDHRHQIRWSNWRRRHQHRAKTCHYQRQAAQDP